MDTNVDKEKTAIIRLQEASQMSLALYGLPLVVAISGGKDSSICIELARRAGIPFEVMHNHTTADAPETVYFLRDDFKKIEAQGIKCTRNYPVYRGKQTSMWNLIPQKLMPPTRKVRYCCDVLKENGGKGRFIVTGVRWAESIKRANNRGVLEVLHKDKEKRIVLNNDNDESRRLFEACTLKGKRVCKPIIDWSDADVWDYIQSEHITTNPLYQEGFKRVGCIGCPMTGTKSRQFEFAKYPKFKDMYIRAFDKMIEERIRRDRMQGTWRIGTTGRDIYHWWMEDGVLPGQLAFEDFGEDLEV